jgi:hypothetical protein
MKAGIRRVLAAWFFAGAVATVLTGLLFFATPSNQSSARRLMLFLLELAFAGVLLWVGWRLWQARRHALPIAMLVLLAQVPAFHGIGASYECTAPVGVYARVYLFSGGNVWYPFLRSVRPAPFLPPIEGYYVEPYSNCGGTLTAQDPPFSSPRSFGWISLNMPALLFLLVAMALGVFSSQRSQAASGHGFASTSSTRTPLGARTKK